CYRDWSSDVCSSDLAWFERALAERQDDTDALQALGVALAECGRVQEAVRCWRAAIQLGANTAHVHDNLSRGFTVLGQRAQARAQIGRASCREREQAR